MKAALVLLLACCLPTVAMAQAPTLPPFPALPPECAPALEDAKLCGGDAPCEVKGQTLATRLPPGQPLATSRLGYGLVATTHESWSANGERWEPLPMPEREARVLSSNRDTWVARSGSESATLRKRTAEGWGPAIAPPSAAGWRYQSGGCVIATLVEQDRKDDVVHSTLSVAAWNGTWTQPWRATVPNPARFRVFQDRDGGLHVFAIVAGPKGQTVWHGRPGQKMRAVAGPTEVDGSGLQPSGYGVYMVQTATASIAVLVSPGGLTRLNLDGGKNTVLFESEARTSTNEKTGLLSTARTQPILVGLVATEHDARLVYRMHTRTVDQKVTPADKARNRRESRVQVGVRNQERVFVLDPLARRPMPREVTIEGYAGEAIGTPGGTMWIVGSRKNGDAADLVVHILTEKPLGESWKPGVFDYASASTEKLRVEFDSERELLDAGFQRWGKGTTTFKKGRMTVTSDSYEEWFSAPSLGLLRGKIGKGYLMKTRMRLVPAPGAKNPNHANAGIRFGGPFGRASLRLTPTLLHFAFEGATAKVSLDCTEMHSLQVAVFPGKAILYRGGIEIARLTRPKQPARTDAVHLVVGALGGSSGAKAEFDELEVTALAK